MVNAEASITVETALLLENVLGGTASFWINLEKHYQETKARLERRSSIVNEINMVSKFPYNELVKRGYVEHTRNNEDRVENLWRFFGVNSLLFFRNTEPIAYRKRSGLDIKSEHIAAWLRCGEMEAKKITLPEYSEAKLKELLPTLKTLSVKQAKEYSKAVIEMLHNAGVGLVYTPHFPGTGVSGAVRWVGNNPLIQLSIYYPWADIFWFNLYH
jgi:HTH-type transcriptional regulator/antitoxin HigA